MRKGGKGEAGGIERESQIGSQEQKDIKEKGQKGAGPLFSSRQIHKIIRCLKNSKGMHR